MRFCVVRCVCVRVCASCVRACVVLLPARAICRFRSSKFCLVLARSLALSAFPPFFRLAPGLRVLCLLSTHAFRASSGRASLALASARFPAFPSCLAFVSFVRRRFLSGCVSAFVRVCVYVLVVVCACCALLFLCPRICACVLHGAPLIPTCFLGKLFAGDVDAFGPSC